MVSSGLTAGCGLKHPAADRFGDVHIVSSGLTAGCGLKPGMGARRTSGDYVSSGLTAGCGLKPSDVTVPVGVSASHPA